MPILEELYYRRILLNSISIKFNSFIAILISSLLFSIGHLDFENTFQFFIMGLILGYFYLKTKKIGLSILLHAFINFFGIFILYKDISLEGFNRLYLVFYLVVIVLIIFLFKRCLKPLILKNIIN